VYSEIQHTVKEKPRLREQAGFLKKWSRSISRVLC